MRKFLTFCILVFISFFCVCVCGCLSDDTVLFVCDTETTQCDLMKVIVNLRIIHE